MWELKKFFGLRKKKEKQNQKESQVKNEKDLDLDQNTKIEKVLVRIKRISIIIISMLIEKIQNKKLNFTHQ